MNLSFSRVNCRANVFLHFKKSPIYFYQNPKQTLRGSENVKSVISKLRAEEVNTAGLL